MPDLIPAMDDPLGKYWDQPEDMTEVPVDGSHAILTPRQFRDLPDYSRSTPSGVYPGKCWKGCDRSGDWYLAWWGADSGDGMLQNFVRGILIVEAG
jgi:hypothetical protein